MFKLTQTATRASPHQSSIRATRTLYQLQQGGRYRLEEDSLRKTLRRRLDYLKAWNQMPALCSLSSTPRPMLSLTV